MLHILLEDFSSLWKRHALLLVLDFQETLEAAFDALPLPLGTPYT